MCLCVRVRGVRDRARGGRDDEARKKVALAIMSGTQAIMIGWGVCDNNSELYRKRVMHSKS